MRDIAFVMYPDYSTTTLTVVMAFEVANSVTEAAPYALHFVSETGGKIRTSSGMMVESEPFAETPFHTLFVGGAASPKVSTPGLIDYIRNAPRLHHRIVAISTGAFVLAEAGLLDGRNATTHWMHAPLFQAQYPAVKLARNCIFTHDGPIGTAAGGAAGLDLSLAIVESDLGADVAKAVARELVVYHRRAGNQSQISTLPRACAENRPDPGGADLCEGQPAQALDRL
jgi:transcriptional regulator GlxA family with amidase domain